MKTKEVKDIISEMPLLNNCKVFHKVDKGWSKDNKFYLESGDGEKYLLRINGIDYYDVKEKEFMIMKKISGLDLNMSEPIDFGICSNGQNVFMLLSWIEGTALDEIITTLTEEDQYDLGVKAGSILKKFHSIPAPTEQEEWEQRMLKKFNYHLEKYQLCGIKVPKDELALEHIKNNLYLLKNRPQTFQHGDFHVGNLILSTDHKLGVIDFNRWDYGDPYEDFYKMMLFSRELSIPFAKGQINGYFGDKIPQDFFKLLSLYLADVILYSVVWAIPFGEDDVNIMLKLAEMIFADYDCFKTEVPRWLAIY